MTIINIPVAQAGSEKIRVHFRENQVEKLTEYHPPHPGGKPAFVVEYQNQGHYPSLAAYFHLEDLLVELHGQEVELMNTHDLDANPRLNQLLGDPKSIIHA